MKETAVLVVEDDANLRVALEDNLRDEGYDVRSAEDGAGARRAWSEQGFDVIILDIMLPDTDGYRLCRELREAGVGARVLMLTARTLESDIVAGFDAGADDYLQKPYRLKELLARVRALSRRGGAPASQVVRFGDVAIDVNARTVIQQQNAVDVTRTEFDLLTTLLQHRDRALSRDELLRQVWGPEVHVEERTVDNFISSLKKKLKWTPSSSWKIRTVRGFGYRMELDD